MKKLLPALLLLLSGCAGLPLIGQLVSVNVPTEIPLPADMTLELGGTGGKAVELSNKVLGVFGQGSVEKNLGAKLKEGAAPLRRSAAEQFKKQLTEAGLFGSVRHEGGQLGIALGIGRWGLGTNAQGALEPVLDLEASLSAPGLGVVWRASRSAKDLGADILKKASELGIAQLAKNPASFQELMNLAAADLSRQLVEDLRKNPPQAR